MTKVIISEEIMETLNVIENLRRLKGVLDCTQSYDLEYLGTRLNTKNMELLADILEHLGAEFVEE